MTKLKALSLLVEYKTKDYEDNKKILNEVTEALQVLLGLAGILTGALEIGPVFMWS